MINENVVGHEYRNGFRNEQCQFYSKTARANTVQFLENLYDLYSRTGRDVVHEIRNTIPAFLFGCSSV